MIFKSKPKPIHILLAALPGLIVAGFWIFANSSQWLTIIDPDPEKPARMIIDTADPSRKTIITPASLDE